MSKPRRVLQQDEENALVAGVVAGLARYFSQDTALFRIAAVTFIVLTGVLPGIVIYLIAWFILARQTNVDYTIDE